MTTSTRLLTADELLRIPDDGFRYELVKGELRKMSPAGHKHGRIAASFTWRLGHHVKSKGLGVVYAAETGFLLSTDPDTVRAPDVAFVTRTRVEAAGDVEGFWPGAPDLAVEVVSPSDTYTEVEENVIEWLQAGAKMVLVLNPRKLTVALNRPSGQTTILNADATLDIGDVVPGFKVAVKDLFD
jgi:Uma2 family endonuclease